MQKNGEDVECIAEPAARLRAALHERGAKDLRFVAGGRRVENRAGPGGRRCQCFPAKEATRRSAREGEEIGFTRSGEVARQVRGDDRILQEGTDLDRKKRRDAK